MLAADHPDQVGETDPIDALFGPTVRRAVETAAVRSQDVADDHPGVVLGVLVFSTGERVLADRSMVIGRRPRSLGDGLDRLVRVANPGVSRQHASVRLDRWRATIEDLGSSNGTTLTAPGRCPVQLGPGSPADLVVGAVVDLGASVSFTVEEIA